MRIVYSCEICQIEVTRNLRPSQLDPMPRYCSRQCAGVAKRTGGKTLNQTFNCRHCGVTARVYRSAREVARSGAPKYCTHACARAHMRGENFPGWKGGRRIGVNGYVYRCAPSHPSAGKHGEVLEHRLVMEEKLRRPLLPTEIVHHINHDRVDNRPENLELFGSRSDHTKHHAHDRRAARHAA